MPAPVDLVGGTQNEGPWPDTVDEIAEGESYERPVIVSDGSVRNLTVNVTGVDDLLDKQGNPTGGYTVTFQYDDPTLDGGTL